MQKFRLSPVLLTRLDERKKHLGLGQPTGWWPYYPSTTDPFWGDLCPSDMELFQQSVCKGHWAAPQDQELPSLVHSSLEVHRPSQRQRDHQPACYVVITAFLLHVCQGQSRPVITELTGAMAPGLVCVCVRVCVQWFRIPSEHSCPIVLAFEAGSRGIWKISASELGVGKNIGEREEEKRG